jgi:hypothetical protein
VACLTRWRNELTSAAAGLRHAAGFHKPMVPRRRVRHDHGVIVALLGIDGSGKTTLTRRILADWESKIDIELVYFGTGDGPRSLLFWLASIPGRLGGRKHRGPDLRSVIDTRPGWRGVSRAVLAARQKRQYMRWARSLRGRGVIVLCDRLPQNQTAGFNDGPLLAEYVGSGPLLKTQAARYEARIFDELVRPGPDAAIRLKPSIDVALARKPGDAPREVLERKLEGLLALEFPAATTAPIVDADGEVPALLLEVKRQVWRAILR